MRFRIFALGLLLAGAAASCIREDMSQCRNAHELVLSYLGDGKTEIFGDKICRVEMYVFDAMNSCVADFVVPAGQVAARTAELPPLVPGDYRVVCLGNTHHTKTVNLSAGSFDAIRFADTDYVDTGAASGNDSLYYASVPVTVTGFTGKEGDRTTLVPFVCSHYDLSVEVAGIPRSDVRAGLLPKLEICGVAPCTDFENRVCGEAVDYTLETRYDADKMLLTSETAYESRGGERLPAHRFGRKHFRRGQPRGVPGRASGHRLFETGGADPDPHRIHLGGCRGFGAGLVRSGGETRILSDYDHA